MDDIDSLSGEVVHAAVRIHRDLGPGLLESVYETVLAGALLHEGLKADRQRPVDIEFEGMHFENAFRADLVVEDRLIVEIKSVEQLSAVHAKQVLTYLRLMKQPVGLLLNFGAPTMKEGIKRLVNEYRSVSALSATPRLRAKQI